MAQFWKIRYQCCHYLLRFGYDHHFFVQVFDLAVIMTEGGPANATNTIVYHIYRNAFQFFRMGYAAAIAWFLFIVIS